MNNHCGREEIRNSILVSLLLTLGIAMIVFVSTAYFQIGSRLDPTIFFVNIGEHFIGLFCIAGAFFLQFSPRIDLPLTASRQPPAKYPVAFFVTGSAFSMAAARLALPEETAVPIEVAGNSIVLVLVVIVFGLVLAKQSPPKTRHDESR